MKDYEPFFFEKYNEVYESLEKRFTEAMNTPGPLLDKRSNFLRISGFEYENILEDRYPKDPFKGSYSVKSNSFKEDILERYKSIHLNYPKLGLNGFVEYDIPLTRKWHIDHFESKESDKYDFDTRFMYDATNEEVLEMIAKYIAYEIFFEDLRSEATEDLSSDNIIESTEATLSQQVLAVYYMLNYMQVRFELVNKTDIARFIQFLTGRNSEIDIRPTNTYKRVKKIFSKGDKKQVQDLRIVLSHFEKLGLEEMTKQIINDIKSYETK